MTTISFQRRLSMLLLTTAVTSCSLTMIPQPSYAQAKVQSQTKQQVNQEGIQNVKELETFIQSMLTEKMKKFNVNGANFVVVKDAKVLLNKGFGYANKERKIPVDSDTVFQIASVSKTFTALAAMQLVDQGKMKLDDDIKHYMNGLVVPNKTGTPLTMFNLLTYTSGFDLPDISNFISPDYVTQDIPMRGFLEEHMPTVVRTPGDSYTYDNVAFLLAGYAVQNASGQRFDQYMKQHIFNPLGMNSTSARFTPKLLNRMAVHYDLTGKPQPTFGHAPTDGPQGSILSTANDMAKYLQMYQQQGKVNGKQIVSKSLIKQMQTYQVFADETIPMTTLGGFEGYSNQLMNGQYVILKGGNMPGHQSVIVLVPEKNTAFYMSYNNDSMMTLEVIEEFMNHYFPKKGTPAPSTYVPLSQEAAKEYVGLYENTRFHFLKSKFSYEDGKLIMETGTTGKHILKMVHPLLFEDEAGNKLAFKKNHLNEVEYFYYTNPLGLDYGSDAQKKQQKESFADVPKDSPYKTYIENMQAYGLIQAQSDNLFHPEGKLTQGEFADLLLRTHGWDTFPFKREQFQEQMLANVPGYDAKALLTREMAAVMIHNLKQTQPAPTVKLVGETDAWAVPAIQSLVSQGIVDPNTLVQADGAVDFRAKQPLLRQEACALLDKAFGAYALPITDSKNSK